MELPVQLRAVLMLMVIASMLLNSQETPPSRPTLVTLDQLDGDSIDWEGTPPSYLASCLVGQWSTDINYNWYVCVPDRRYMKPGHKPQVWLRFKPDPTWLPADYLDPFRYE
jgi:hypothetical protein